MESNTWLCALSCSQNPLDIPSALRDVCWHSRAIGGGLLAGIMVLLGFLNAFPKWMCRCPRSDLYYKWKYAGIYEEMREETMVLAVRRAVANDTTIDNRQAVDRLFHPNLEVQTDAENNPGSVVQGRDRTSEEVVRNSDHGASLPGAGD